MYNLHLYYVFSNAVLSQECFTQPNCVGSSLNFTVSSARECCAGTEEGMSYSENGTCTVTQCIGEKSLCPTPGHTFSMAVTVMWICTACHITGSVF